MLVSLKIYMGITQVEKAKLIRLRIKKRNNEIVARE
jgi:hypothetical protein